MKKIGAITVGQTPRTDLIPEIAPILGDSIEIIQMGGLDGLTKEEIQTMTPAPGERTEAPFPLESPISCQGLRPAWTS